MRFLADQDVYHLTVALLRSHGHDVLTAREAALSQSPDLALLTYARQQQRILVTRDTDFGSLVFAGEAPSNGVILLRLTPSSLDTVHSQLMVLLSDRPEQELMTAFTVVEPGRHRIRRLS